jgi:hypothetical protein
MRRNSTSEVWAILRQRWSRLVDFAAAEVEARDQGRAHQRAAVQAAETVAHVARHADEMKIIEVMLAVFLLESANPLRFRSDEAFRFTLLRRLRHLAPMARGTYWNHNMQRMGSVYRDMPPRAARIVGMWLVEVFGLAGKLVAESERKRLEMADDRRRLVEAAEALA